MYMYKLGVIGDKDTVLAFKALGLATFPVLNPEKAKITLRRLVNENYAAVFITEQIAEKISDTIEEFIDNVLPAIILIPNNSGSLGIGTRNVKASVEKAIGVDILFESEGEEIETR
jgi:V/A-type H+-transporting ATPase subunit F